MNLTEPERQAILDIGSRRPSLSPNLVADLMLKGLIVLDKDRNPVLTEAGAELYEQLKP